MSKLNNYSKNIFNPIEFKYTFIDLAKSIKIGIKFKYIFLYLPALLILYFMFYFLLCLKINYNSDSFYLISFIYILLFILTITIIDCFSAKMAFEEFKGNFAYDWNDGFSFIKKNIFSILLPPFLIIMILFTFLLIILFFMYLSKIIIIGPLILSFSYMILFLLGLMCLFTFITFLITINFSQVIFPLYGGDSFTTIFQCYSLVWSNLIYLIIYSFTNFILSFVFLIFIGTIFYFNISIINLFLSNDFLLGKQYDILLQQVKSILLYNNFEFINLNTFEMISSFLLSFIIIFIMMYLFSLFLSIVNIGKMITFINIKKNSYNYNVFTNNI